MPSTAWYGSFSSRSASSSSARSTSVSARLGSSCRHSAAARCCSRSCRSRFKCPPAPYEGSCCFTTTWSSEGSATRLRCMWSVPNRADPGVNRGRRRRRSELLRRGASSTPSVVGPPSPGPPARVIRETRKSLCRSRRSSSSHPIIACTRTLLPGRIRYAKPCRLHGIHLRRRPDRPILGADRDGPISRPHPRDPASPTEARQYWARHLASSTSAEPDSRP
jgi:hypothetical protein